MAAPRVQYQIVGRYMDGKDVTGYHLQSLESGKSGKYTREQIAYLVGRGQITNCEAQIYKDKLLLRGVGMSLDELPVQQENGGMSRLNGVGHIRRGATTEDVMETVNIVGVVTNGRSVVQYVVMNSGGGKQYISRENLLSLAKAGRVGNARVQMYNGNIILKGINCDLKQLPRVDINSMQ
jgi:hypothetical protein